MNIWVVLCITSMFAAIFATPQQGKYQRTITLGSGKLEFFFKTLYNGSTIKISITEKHCTPTSDQLKLKWTARSSSCFSEYGGLVGNTQNEILRRYLYQPFFLVSNIPTSGSYRSNNDEDGKFGCDTTMILTDFSDRAWSSYPITPTNNKTTDALTRRKRDAAETTEKNKSSTEKTDDNIKKPASQTNTPGLVTTTSKHVVATVAHEAPYILVVEVISLTPGNVTTGSVEISVEMETPLGFLSAHEYPLLTFYMIMCIIYSLYAVAWLIMSACNFRDLLRVQFWIGGVILLGMIEKAVFYSEYLSVNSTGESVTGAAKFAEVVSALKRSLARMLVIIVSLGFGIVKPRLGPMLHRVIGIGALYFILAVVESLVRTDTGMYDPRSRSLLFAQIPLAVTDSVICWWIFISLMQTMKTLRLRRNVVKLSLYRHFSNTIIFCVIASLIMIFYTFYHRDDCAYNWKELWIVDVAFWHLLFSVILLVIMILWRPNINNQRYAFSPLIDGADDDDDESGEQLLGAGATETIKMRGLKNAADPVHNTNTKTEDDLKWIEENIPQTLADAALPAIMDSDEEVMTTKYEMNKME